MKCSCKPAAPPTLPQQVCLCAQVASKEFFLKTLPLFDGGDDVGMVLSPQCFHNLNLHCDIFNHSNVHFWEYMQPGYDALGFISCTGTNFLVRLACVHNGTMVVLLQMPPLAWSGSVPLSMDWPGICIHWTCLDT